MEEVKEKGSVPIKGSLMEVIIISMKFLFQFWILSPIKVWVDSRSWIASNANFFNEKPVDHLRYIPMLEAITYVAIFMSWVIGVILTLFISIAAASGYGGASAFFGSLFIGLIVTYFVPVGLALSREILTIIITVARRK